MAKHKSTTATCPRCGGKLKRLGQRGNENVHQGMRVPEAGYEKCTQCTYRKPR